MAKQDTVRDWDGNVVGTSPLRLRPGDQPLPVLNDEPAIQDAVIADIVARKQLGIQRYGSPLKPHNGRDALRDAYEETVDQAMYLKQLLVERDALWNSDAVREQIIEAYGLGPGCGQIDKVMAVVRELMTAVAVGEYDTRARLGSMRGRPVSADNRPAEEVAGYCPACGKQSLRLMAGGHVTCCRIECPRADAASAILHDPETQHIVQLGETEFTVRHPLIERLGDALMDCDLHAEIAAGSGPPFGVGRYRVSGAAGSRAWEGLRA